MAKGILLLSGGIDSAVAGHLAIKEGHTLCTLHFSTEKITGKEPTEKSRKLASMLGIKDFFRCEASTAFAEISRTCFYNYYFVLIKRLMLCKAAELAEKEKADFIVTGENLGQVSSQTLSNLSSIDRAVSLPVIRPLLSLDKTEIIRIAREIGTLETSTGKEMCDALGPKHPATKTDYSKVVEEEKKLPADFFEKLKLVYEKL
ncbi:MAG: 7-cyano-7-deazaguanine synthase [Candidatus Diapherotrites archaeon]|nr:7-cyano-7-deazaguanine synthase [Candidatus Diapherotrites archaeon]